MTKYRLQVVEKANGQKIYYVHYRKFGIWWCLREDYQNAVGVREKKYWDNKDKATEHVQRRINQEKDWLEQKKGEKVVSKKIVDLNS